MKLSIVTPSFNSARFIRETMLSVITQAGDFSIQYIVCDNCSTDDTKRIVTEVQRLLENGELPIACNGVELIFKSEPDQGMYDAISKGFALANGDVMAWINSDDIYLPGAFSTIARVFSTFDDVNWVKGITSYITENSSVYRTGQCLLYTQEWIKIGAYGRDDHFIQQDSVFWRSWLWKEAGQFTPDVKLAGDYLLWSRFAKLTPLISIQSLLSCFRYVEGQLSQDSETYLREAIAFLPGNDPLSKKIKTYTRYEKYLGAFLKRHYFRLMFGRPVYNAIRIDKQGNLKRVSGERYEVAGSL